MALREIRVCEVTDEPDAVIVPISVGSLRWHVDLSVNGQKLLLEALLPFTSKGTLVVGGEGDDYAAEAGDPDVEPDPTSPPGDEDEDSPSLTDDERAAARQWAKRAVNWKRCGLNRPPGDRGKLHRAVEEGWINAGRPGAPAG